MSPGRSKKATSRETGYRHGFAVSGSSDLHDVCRSDRWRDYLERRWRSLKPTEGNRVKRPDSRRGWVGTISMLFHGWDSSPERSVECWQTLIDCGPAETPFTYPTRSNLGCGSSSLPRRRTMRCQFHDADPHQSRCKLCCYTL